MLFLNIKMVYCIMNKRINLSKVSPEAYEAMIGLESYIAKSGLDKKLYELIKTRTSQLNGCAYCINMHTRDAMKLGETPQRLFLLDAWRETELYSERERAVLALTEEMTLIAGRHVSDDVYNEAAKHLTDKELAAVIMSVVAINGWNRISITAQSPLD
jgi:AhpD family alkylhydroperoxidase